MAKKKHGAGTGNADYIDMEELVYQGYLTYAEETLVRFVPRAEDGLILVWRRLLQSLYEKARSGPSASAKIVGHCVGEYHPHSPEAVYGSAVFLAHERNITLPLVKFYGNRGSADSGEANMRYTQLALSEYSELIIQSKYFPHIDRIPDYNMTGTEAEFLPARFPIGLLLNFPGIPVGYSFTQVSCRFPELVESILKYVSRVHKTGNTKMTPADTRAIRKPMTGPECGYACVINVGGRGHVSDWLNGSDGLDRENQTVKFTYNPEIEIILQGKSPTIVFHERLSPQSLIKSLSRACESNGIVADIGMFSASGKTVKDRRPDVQVILDKTNSRSLEEIIATLQSAAQTSRISFPKYLGKNNRFRRKSGLESVLEIWFDYRMKLEERYQKSYLENIKSRQRFLQILRAIVTNNLTDTVVRFIQTNHHMSDPALAKKLLSILSNTGEMAVLCDDDVSHLQKILELRVSQFKWSKNYQNELDNLTKEKIPKTEKILSSRENLISEILTDLKEIQKKFAPSVNHGSRIRTLSDCHIEFCKGGFARLVHPDIPFPNISWRKPVVYGTVHLKHLEINGLNGRTGIPKDGILRFMTGNPGDKKRKTASLQCLKLTDYIYIPGLSGGVEESDRITQVGISTADRKSDIGFITNVVSSG